MIATTQTKSGQPPIYQNISVGNFLYTLAGTTAPEPASAALLGLGALLLAARRRR